MESQKAEVKNQKSAAETRPPTEMQMAEAVRAHRGGHEQTPDGVLVRLFKSLPAETQQRYLNSKLRT